MSESMNFLICEAILFDLDGVLIDSSLCVERHWREWAETHGVDGESVVGMAHGVRSMEVIQQFAPHLDAEAEAARYSTNEVLDTEGVCSMEGARHLLESLLQDRWAVVTSCSLELAKARIKKANLPFPRHMVTADDVSNGKPDPEPFLQAARRLSVPPERCVVVEDAPAGIRSGHTAGMKVIGIRTHHELDELSLAGADFVVGQLADLTIKEQGVGYRIEIIAS
jgi:sugar-phosphatase